MSEDNQHNSDTKPTHLKAEDPSSWKKPEDETWGDWTLAPGRPLCDRHRELARMMAHGKTNTEIMEKLGYSASRVSVLRTAKKIKDAAEVYRDKLFGVDAQTRLKELSGDALNVMDSILSSKSIPDEDKENAARWVLEKTTGKPAQQIDVTVEASVGVFLDQLDKMKTIPALPASTPIDIIPKGESISVDAPEKEPIKVVGGFSNWLDNNCK